MRGRIDWSTHHMALAAVTAQRSPDPNTQVGAAVVSPDNKVLALGYNGPPKGIEPHEIPWGREGEFHDTKYAYVRHAEVNAIANSTASLKGCDLYTTLHPCNACAMDIIQHGISRVFYLRNPYASSPPVLAAVRLFAWAGVSCKLWRPVSGFGGGQR